MAKSTSIQNSTWLTLAIAAAALSYFAFFAKPGGKKQQNPTKIAESENDINENGASEKEINALGELSAPVISAEERAINEASRANTNSEQDEVLPDNSERLPEEISSLVGIDPNNLPEDLPEDLKEQLRNPPPLPDDLKAQLESPPGPIPPDIEEALKTPPREITIEEVNSDPNLR